MQRPPTHPRSVLFLLHLRLAVPSAQRAQRQQQASRFSTTQSNDAAKSKSKSKLPSSSLHNDLASFRRYATDVDLPVDTTVYVGTIYEYTVLRVLSRLGMLLTRVGGRDDRGVDLLGTWSPPPALPSRPALRIYVQCKAERARAGPKFLRELEGTLGTTATRPLGILATSGFCTPGMRRHMQLSRMPLAYCCVEPREEGGYIKQLIWNAAAAELIGNRVRATTKFVPTGEVGEDGEEEIRMEAVLTVDGQPFEPVEGTIEDKGGVHGDVQGDAQGDDVQGIPT